MVPQVLQEPQVQAGLRGHQVQVEHQGVQVRQVLQEKVFSGKVISPTGHFIQEILLYTILVVHT